MMRAAWLVAFAFLVSPLAEAGPWTVGKSGLYLNLKYNFTRTTTLATPDGTSAEIPEFTLHQMTYYAVYGAHDRLDVIFDGTAYRDSAIDGFESASGIGDTRFGAQYLLVQRGTWALSTRGLLQAPTGDETKGLGLLPTGSGAWEGFAILSAGKSFADGRLYAYGELGHHFRARSLRDGLVYELQLGAHVGERLVTAFTIRGIEPYRSELGDEALASPSGLGDGTTYTTYGPTAILRMGRGWAVQLELDGIFNTKNVADGPTFRAGLVFTR